MFPTRSIAIVGGDACGWLAAATLARVLGASCSVRVVESPAGEAGAFAGAPSLHRLLKLLGLDEVALMRATQATYRLGAWFAGWNGPDSRYFQGFGAIGAPLDAVPFQHHWLRSRGDGGSAALGDFSMAERCARLHRFALPQRDPRAMPVPYQYAWHFDAPMLAAELRRCALAAGVTRVTGEVMTADLDADGSVRTLLLADGRVDADLFIDCSEAQVLRAALGMDWEDWSAWLPCDRLQVMRAPPDATLPPCSEVRLDAHGWQLSVPLQHASVRGFAYSSELTRDEEAAAMLTADGAPQIRRLLRGRPKEFWTRNCVFVPARSFDPLEGTELHLVQTGIMRLLAHFPVRASSAPDRAEYNRLTIEEYERLRDLLVLHYHAGAHGDSPFWQHCATMTIPETLARRLALFVDSGRLTIGEEEHCGTDGWLAVLLGQGVVPKSWDPFAATAPIDAVRATLARIAGDVGRYAAALPTHREFLAQRGAAAALPPASGSS